MPRSVTLTSLDDIKTLIRANTILVHQGFVDSSVLSVKIGSIMFHTANHFIVINHISFRICSPANVPRGHSVIILIMIPVTLDDLILGKSKFMMKTINLFTFFYITK